MLYSKYCSVLQICMPPLVHKPQLLCGSALLPCRSTLKLVSLPHQEHLSTLRCRLGDDSCFALGPHLPPTMRSCPTQLCRTGWEGVIEKMLHPAYTPVCYNFSKFPDVCKLSHLISKIISNKAAGPTYSGLSTMMKHLPVVIPDVMNTHPAIVYGVNQQFRK